MKKYPATRPLLRASLFTLVLAANMVAHAEEVPLSGPAYRLADEAYKDFARGNYNLAATKAQEAIRLRPDVARLHDLLQKANAAAASRAALKQNAARKKAPDSADSAAYAAAKSAYSAYARRDYAAAVESAERAVDLAPDSRAYRLLLINSLAADGKLEKAEHVSADAIKKFGRQPDLLAAQEPVHAELAFQASAASYSALASADFSTAVDEARKAVRYLPGAPALHIALINALITSKDLPAAQQAATDMLALGKPASEALLLRGAIRQRLGVAQAAEADFDRALAISGPGTQAQNGIRLVAADAALVNGDAPRALRLLAPLKDSAAPPSAVRNTLAALIQQAGANQARSAWTFHIPLVSCSTAKDLAMDCTIVPGAAPADPGFLAADEAYRAFNGRNYALAAERAGNAARLSPKKQDYRLLHVQALAAQSLLVEAEQAATAAIAELGNDAGLLLARAEIRKRQGHPAANADYAAILTLPDSPPRIEIAALIGLGRNEEAQTRLAEVVRKTPGGSDLELAYLALQLHDDRTALDLFSQADTNGKLGDTARYDAAYAASRLGRNAQAVGYFEQIVDAAGSRRLALEPQQIYDARRAVADLSRRWGARASLSKRGMAVAGIGVPQGGTIDGVDAGAEVYWRPYGFQNGKLFEIYGRFNETVAGGTGVQTGSATAQGAIGARVKPFSNTNVVLAAERLVALGSLANSTWLARAGFSTGSGIDFKVGQSNWFTSHLYAEAGHYFRDSQNYATLEGQVGRSYRLGGDDSTIAVFPHLVIGGDYDSALVDREKQAWGGGIGTNLRYWFRQDRYNAPRSHTDVSLQYRWKIAGDQRAEGLFVRISASY